MSERSISGGNSRPLPRAGATAVWALAIGVPLGIGVLVLVTPPPERDAWAIPVYSLIIATWGLTGAFLVTRRPDNRVGWVLLAVGLGMGVGSLGTLWAYLSLTRHDGLLPGTVVGALLGLLFFSALNLVMLVPLLFPDGRLMSRRWAAVVALLLLSTVMAFMGTLLRPGPIEGAKWVENPLGVPALAGLSQALGDLGGLGALVCIPAGIAAALLRYRRGSAVERKQLQWFGSVLVLAFSMFFAAVLLPQPYGQGAWIVASVSMGLIPVSIAIAILRYRLYEIDRIVSRTIGWMLVTALLLAVFAGGVIALQAVLAGVTQGQTLAVAASTLVAFALFQPVRRQVQRAVDRRFDRARYDGERTAAAFADRLRDEVDLVAVVDSLRTTAHSTVRPTNATVWLRESREGGR